MTVETQPSPSTHLARRVWALSALVWVTGVLYACLAWSTFALCSLRQTFSPYYDDTRIPPALSAFNSAVMVTTFVSAITVVVFVTSAMVVLIRKRVKHQAFGSLARGVNLASGLYLAPCVLVSSIVLNLENDFHFTTAYTSAYSTWRLTEAFTGLTLYTRVVGYILCVLLLAHSLLFLFLRSTFWQSFPASRAPVSACKDASPRQPSSKPANMPPTKEPRDLEEGKKAPPPPPAALQAPKAAATAPFKGYESHTAVTSAHKAMVRAEGTKAQAERPAAPAPKPSPGDTPAPLQGGRRDIDLGNGQSMRVSVTPGGAVRTALVKGPLGTGAFGSKTTSSDYSARRSLPRSSGSGSSSAETAGDTPGARPLQLPELPFSDWELDPRELQMCTRPDGSAWQLGSGAFGTVFKALFGGIDEVAVKVFHGKADPQQEEAILKEVAILRGCKHDCIVPFLGACYEAGSQRFQLVTQFCAGGDLFSAIRELRACGDELTWYKRGRGIALDIARGLHYLHHHRRLLHADLKSSNVLLTSTGAARICDVGFADILDSTRVVRAAGFTFAWAAPELLEGRPCTTKADIYSFGVVLWELARGLPPRRGQLSPCRVPEECPPEVEDMIVGCLAVDPEERPSARQLAEALKALQEQPAPPDAGYVDDSALGP